MKSSRPSECLSLPGFSGVSSSFLGHPAHSAVWLRISSGIAHVFVSFTIDLTLVSLDDDDDDSIFRPCSTLMGYWAVPTTPADIVILSISTYNL